MQTKPDYFKENAKEWDKRKMRVQNAQNIARKIIEQVQLTGDESIIDFGAGTGLLSESIAPKVKKITAIDYSEAMLSEFDKKDWPCETETMKIDLTEEKIDQKYDGIISSMTLHHIKDLPRLLENFYQMLKPGAFIALGDLEKEDGSFHSSNMGVEHLGFEEDEMKGWLSSKKFKNIQFSRANVISKEVDGELKDFPIFLVTATI